MASRPSNDTTHIGKALSQPHNVWRLFRAAQHAALYSTDPDTRNALSGLLTELQFGPREHADELLNEEAEARTAALTWSHDIAESEVAK